MSSPVYESVRLDLDPDARYWLCRDCGSLVIDQFAHTRFHSILSAHAWAIAILVNRHISAPVHDRYDTYDRVKSKHFDNWSADALAEVVKEAEDE